MKVALEPFACACIEARFGVELSAGAQAAVRHYARRLRSQTPPAEIPGFRRGGAAEGGAAELDLKVPAEVEDLLRQEARNQGVSLERIVAHAVFVYIADLDAPTGERSEPAEEAAIASRYRSNGCASHQDSPSRRRRTARFPVPLSRRRGRGVRGRSRFGKR